MTTARLAPDLIAELEQHSRREDEQIVEEVGMLSHEGKRLAFLLVRPKVPSRTTAVVVCHSLFEFKMLQSAEIALARAAANQGFPAIYVQAPGMGDSEGPSEGCTVDVRVAASLAAATYVRDRRPEVEHICLFGARLGGAVAALAAQELPETSIAVWDPAFTAEDYWKQAKRFGRVVATLSAERTFADPEEQLSKTGKASFLGYQLTRDLIDDLTRIDSVSHGPRLKGPALVVSLNDQMVAAAVKTLSGFVDDVEGASLGRPKPRHLIHMGIQEAKEAVGATLEWMERRLT